MFWSCEGGLGGLELTSAGMVQIINYIHALHCETIRCDEILNLFKVLFLCKIILKVFPCVE